MCKINLFYYVVRFFEHCNRYIAVCCQVFRSSQTIYEHLKIPHDFETLDIYKRMFNIRQIYLFHRRQFIFHNK